MSPFLIGDLLSALCVVSALAAVFVGLPLLMVWYSDRNTQMLVDRQREEYSRLTEEVFSNAARSRAASEPVAQSGVAIHNPGRRRLMPLDN